MIARLVTKRTRNWIGRVAGLCLAIAASCQADSETGGLVGSDPTGSDPGDSEPTDYQPSGGGEECLVDDLLRPHSYGSKVKTLLTGLALDAEELTALQSADASGGPTAARAELRALIEEWLDTPEAEAVLQGFFKTAFQQTGGTPRTLFQLMAQQNRPTRVLLGSKNTDAVTTEDMLHATFAEGFARTVVKMLHDERPFTEVVTTDTYEMSTAQMVYLAFRDDQIVADDRSAAAHNTQGDFNTITLLKNEAQQPALLDALDPNHDEFLHFYDERMDASCPSEIEVTVAGSSSTWMIPNNNPGNFNVTRSYFVFNQMVLGLPLRVRPHDGNSSDCSLGSQAGKSVLPLLDKAAYTDWRTVKLVPVATADDATPFYRVPQLVADTPEGQTVELSVRTEHRGFLTSPGFLHTWPSNEDNAMRVTTNQALIVALGESFSGVALDGYEPSYGNQAADDEHASADECYACHQTLDPMRTFYRGSLSQYYGPQLGEPKDYQAEFRFGGESQDGVGIGDFAHALATHPWFAHAWVQKFCYYANAQACPEGVELDRIAEIFSTESDDRGLFSLRALLAELFSSPLITGSECGPGLGAPPPAVIARKSTFCSQLEHRLGAEANVCGADPMTAIEGTLTQEPGNVLRRNIRDAMAAVPEDTFSRDQADPVIIADTSLFTYGNREAACSHFANNAGNDGADFDAIFMLGSREDALQTMVTQVMGLPTSDERFTEALAVLQAHAQSVFDDENNTSDQERLARQSAFILACMAPSSAGVGF